eukprot:333382-Amphidinium_carterae.1
MHTFDATFPKKEAPDGKPPRTLCLSCHNEALEDVKSCVVGLFFAPQSLSMNPRLRFCYDITALSECHAAALSQAASGLEAHLGRLCEEVTRAVDAGCQIVVLSDRSTCLDTTDAYPARQCRIRKISIGKPLDGLIRPATVLQR